MKKTIEKLESGKQVTIVVLGDSNSEITWHTKGHLNWVGLLHEALFEKYGRGRVTMINSSCCGGTAKHALERLEHDALRFEPDLVILAYGMNDGDIVEYEASVRAIIARLRASGGEVLLRTPNPIIVSNQPDLPPSHKPGEVWPGKHQERNARKLVEIANELNCPIVDHYALWLATPRRQDREEGNHLWMRMSDAIHPDMLGHRIFYRELAPLFGLPTHFSWEE